uniref:ATP synthase subunit 8 n=1 Tax=Osedax rubiplumus TaxID=283784 RepID=A0A6M4AFR3_OSERU|nr:ATP synthase subunit 8 [Osedax rubiplumus]QJQ26887.1 ATP synthase subunit 8 [Osedax rubiplumus]
MPHLAPMSWMFLPSLFFFSIIMTASMIWWTSSISFPCSTNSLTHSMEWNWI